ncbi:hypothetical protein V2G26_009780 [Clonostachys chloroleuca]
MGIKNAFTAPTPIPPRSIHPSATRWSITKITLSILHVLKILLMEFEVYFNFTRIVALEDLELSERAQMNLNIGIYIEGLLNPNKENGISYHQTQVLDMLCSV